MGRLLQPHGFHDRGSDINIGDHTINSCPCFEQVRTLHQHGYPNGGLVRNTFVDQSVFTKHKPVVTHVDDEGFVMDAHLLQLFHDSPNTVVH